MFQLQVKNLDYEDIYTFVGLFSDIKDAIQLASRYYYNDNVICIINVV